MKKVLYSPDVIGKITRDKAEYKSQVRCTTSNKIIKNILSVIKEIRTYENKGVSVASMTGIPCEYRMIFTEHNYVFYKIEKTAILIIDIYNEKEDFMWKLFGIKTISDEIEIIGMNKREDYICILIKNGRVVDPVHAWMK